MIKRSHITFGQITQVRKEHDTDGTVYTPIISFKSTANEVIQFDVTGFSREFFSPKIGLKKLIIHDTLKNKTSILKIQSKDLNDKHSQ